MLERESAQQTSLERPFVISSLSVDGSITEEPLGTVAASPEGIRGVDLSVVSETSDYPVVIAGLQADDKDTAWVHTEDDLEQDARRLVRAVRRALFAPDQQDIGEKQHLIELLQGTTKLRRELEATQENTQILRQLTLTETACGNELLRQHTPTLQKIALSMYRQHKGSATQDLVQEGQRAFLLSIPRWNFENGYMTALSYGFACARNAMMDYMRHGEIGGSSPHLPRPTYKLYKNAQAMADQGVPLPIIQDTLAANASQSRRIANLLAQRDSYTDSFIHEERELQHHGASVESDFADSEADELLRSWIDSAGLSDMERFVMVCMFDDGQSLEASDKAWYERIITARGSVKQADIAAYKKIDKGSLSRIKASAQGKLQVTGAIEGVAAKFGLLDHDKEALHDYLISRRPWAVTGMSNHKVVRALSTIHNEFGEDFEEVICGDRSIENVNWERLVAFLSPEHPDFGTVRLLHILTGYNRAHRTARTISFALRNLTRNERAV